LFPQHTTAFFARSKHWGIDQHQIKIINLRVSEIAAAWQRGDIDVAYVWEPALGKIKASGHTLITSEEVAKWGHQRLIHGSFAMISH
jgi:taurine transport system substrate-binding protein